MASRSATGDMAGGSGLLSDMEQRKLPVIDPQMAEGAVGNGVPARALPVACEAEAVVANMQGRLIGDREKRLTCCHNMFGIKL